MKRGMRGFTLIELMIVILVIGILTTIAIVTYAAVQAHARDTARASEASAIAGALESYYVKNGEYPGCPAMTGDASSLVGTNGIFPTLGTKDLITPKAPSGTTNSIQCQDMTSTNQGDFFAYVGDGSTDCSTGSSCLEYTLKYIEEADNKVISIESRHRESVTTSGAIADVTATPTGFGSLSVVWSGVQNANGYEIEYATDSAFTTGMVASSVSTATASLSGLSYNTKYYVRVAPLSQVDQGNWSNIASATTWSLATPTLAAGTITSSSIAYTWGAISHADDYEYQLSTSSSFSSIAKDLTSTTTSGSATGLTSGTAYYARVRARANSGAYTGSWSSTLLKTTTISAPPSFSISTANTYNWLNATANANCPDAGASETYKWTANGSAWVSGTGYHTVGYNIGNGSSVTLTEATACTNAGGTSAYTNASNSVSLTWAAPTASMTIPSYRTAAWTGTCPSGYTSANYYWRLSGGAINASGNTSGPSSYDGTAVAWGDGGGNLTLTCYGPWGSLQATSWTTYGAGCVPTVTKSQCYG